MECRRVGVNTGEYVLLLVTLHVTVRESTYLVVSLSLLPYEVVVVRFNTIEPLVDGEDEGLSTGVEANACFGPNVPAVACFVHVGAGVILNTSSMEHLTRGNGVVLFSLGPVS